MPALPTISPNIATLQEIRDLLKSGTEIDGKTRDILLFSAIVDLYGLTNTHAEDTHKKLGEVNKILEPVACVYKFGAWAAAIIGTALLDLVALSGKLEIIVKP